MQARRLPVEVLTRVVRSVFEPNEYPASLARLLAWTPDEAIPEFYARPEAFLSQHAAMPDLAVPGWAAGPEDFIARHRSFMVFLKAPCILNHTPCTLMHRVQPQHAQCLSLCMHLFLRSELCNAGT
jgi:WD repeat-containing protein 81